MTRPLHHPAEAAARARVAEHLRALLTPEGQEDVCAWAERELVLAGPTEVLPGPLNLSRTPYLRGILRAAADDSTSQLTICAATQTGKTLADRILLGWHVARGRAGALVVFPSDAMAKGFSRRRWMPLVHASPCLRARLPDDKDTITNLSQEFDGGRVAVRLTGAGTPANISSEPAALVICDETDKLKSNDPNEGDPVELAEERVKGFPGRTLRVRTGTPTVEDAPVWVGLTAGTHEVYEVPCQACGHRFAPALRDLRWPDDCRTEEGEWDLARVHAGARLHCPSCDHAHDEGAKATMLEAGEWRATNPHPSPGWRSFRLTTLISPFVTWATVAVRFLEAKATPGALHNFTNSWLADVWRDAFAEDTGELSRAVDPAHQRGAEPGVRALMTVDVQRAELIWLVRRYGPQGSWLVDHGVVPAWEDLDAVAEKYRPERTAVDTGYGERTAETYEAIAKRRGRGWVGVKGWDRLSAPIRSTKVDPFSGKRKGLGSGVKVEVLNLDQSVWKAEMSKARTGNLPGWKVYAGIEADAAYRREMFDEQPVVRKSRQGAKKTVWVAATGQNHCWDLECYQRALAYSLRYIGPRTIWAAVADDGAGLPGALPPDPAREGEDVKPAPRYVPISKRA